MSEVRICENCGYHNGINNLECENCGYDLSFVVPVEEGAAAENISDISDAEEASPLQLVSADNQVIIPLTNETIIGRDGVCAAYFERSKFVSRKHAIVYIENNETLIFDVSTNGTFLNDKRLPKLTKVPIHNNDRITFADVTFEVKNAN